MRLRTATLALLPLIGACASALQHAPTGGSSAAVAPFVPAPTAAWGELLIEGRVQNLSVTPAHEVWITTMGGNYLAPRIDANWVPGTIPTRVDERTGRTFGPRVDGIEFFDDSIGIAWGLGIMDRDRQMVQVLRTEDGGRTWEPVDVGVGSWAGAAFVRSDGHAWIAVPSPFVPTDREPDRIFHSADAGRTWTPLEPLPPTSSPIDHLVMETPEIGFMAELNDGIYRTTDGGRTWAPIPTPQKQGAYEKDWRRDQFARIHRFAPFGDWLIVRQDAGTYVTRRDSIRWETLDRPKVIDVALDRTGSRLFVVDDSLGVHELADDLSVVWSSSARLAAPPVSLAVVDGRVYAIDMENRVYDVDRSGMTATFPLTSDGPARPMTIVRQGEGDLWGSTGRNLYTSPDEAATWLRLPYDTATVAGIRPRSRDEAFVWDGRGVNTIVNRRLGTTRPVPDLAGMDVIDVVERDGTWYAYGGLQYETAGRIAVARSFLPGEFRGTRDHGFVYRSDDCGESWTLVDHWPEGGVMRLFLHDDGALTLHSYTGSIRRVHRTLTGYEAENLLLAGRDNLDEVPYVEHGWALYFTTPDTGFIGGWIHHVGNRFFRTEDGGRTWARIEEDEFPYRALRPWGDAYLGIRDSRLYRLSGDEISEIANVSPYLTGEYARIRSVSDAADGALLVHLSTNTLLLLEPETGEVEVLHGPAG